MRKPFSDMTVAGKMLAGYAVPAVFTVVIAVYILVSLIRLNSLSRAVINVDVRIQKTADEMINAVLAQNAYEKRFLILKRKDLRYLFWERAKEFNDHLDDLEKLRRRAGLPVAALRRLHRRYGDLFLLMIKRVQAGKTASAEALSNGEAKTIVDRILAALRDISGKFSESQDGRMNKIAEIGETAFRTTLKIWGTSIAAGVVAALLITRHISLSLGQIKTAVDQIVVGNLGYEPRIMGEDEVGDLARTFRAMEIKLKKVEEIYLDASPLTRLPGGLAIERELEKRLRGGESVALCVMDIDNFKSFNDRYGYARGNEVIRETAHIIENTVRALGSPADFVGHVGGDDFVVVTDPARMREIGDEIIGQFDRMAPRLYDPGDRKRGHIIGKTRQGVKTTFPIMTISIAIVTNRHRVFSSSLQMSEVAAELKDYAKTFSRSLYVVDKRRT